MMGEYFKSSHDNLKGSCDVCGKPTGLVVKQGNKWVCLSCRALLNTPDSNKSFIDTVIDDFLDRFNKEHNAMENNLCNFKILDSDNNKSEQDDISTDELKHFRIIDGNDTGYGAPLYKCELDGTRIEEWYDLLEVVDARDADALVSKLQSKNEKLLEEISMLKQSLAFSRTSGGRWFQRCMDARTESIHFKMALCSLRVHLAKTMMAHSDEHTCVFWGKVKEYFTKIVGRKIPSL